MSERKWTPGVRRIVHFDSAQEVVVASGSTVAVFTGKNRQADAQLDAAAPELYDALEAICNLWDSRRSNDAIMAELHAGAVMTNAFLALKKARGEA